MHVWTISQNVLIVHAYQRWGRLQVGLQWTTNFKSSRGRMGAEIAFSISPRVYPLSVPGMFHLILVPADVLLPFPGLFQSFLGPTARSIVGQTIGVCEKGVFRTRDG
jgi:hypothetical protein